MHCATCGHHNPERATFRLECGAPATACCASCGTDQPPAAEFRERAPIEGRHRAGGGLPKTASRWLADNRGGGRLAHCPRAPGRWSPRRVPPDTPSAWHRCGRTHPGGFGLLVVERAGHGRATSGGALRTSGSGARQRIAASAAVPDAESKGCEQVLLRGNRCCFRAPPSSAVVPFLITRPSRGRGRDVTPRVEGDGGGRGPGVRCGGSPSRRRRRSAPARPRSRARGTPRGTRTPTVRGRGAAACRPPHQASRGSPPA